MFGLNFRANSERWKGTHNALLSSAISNVSWPDRLRGCHTGAGASLDHIRNARAHDELRHDCTRAICGTVDGICGAGGTCDDGDPHAVVVGLLIRRTPTPVGWSQPICVRMRYPSSRRYALAKRSIASLTGALILAGGLAGPALSQGTPQTVALVKVDPQTVATGFRSSKVVGASVVNEANETVGAIDDLIVTSNERVPYAILSVGGFLGLGTKYVVVPFNSLQMHDNKIVLPGATKDALKALPEFRYKS